MGLRTVANKLPESHLSKVPLDKLLSYNNSSSIFKKDIGPGGRFSDLTALPARLSSSGPTLYEKTPASGDKSTSPIKTPGKSGILLNDSYSGSRVLNKLPSGSVPGLRDDMTIEERKETSSNSQGAVELQVMRSS